MPKRLISVTVALAVISLPIYAQRGGGHAGPGGHSGGFVSAGSDAHSSFSRPTHSSFPTIPQFRGNQLGSSRFSVSQRPAFDSSNRRNDHDADDRFRSDRFRRPYNSVYSFGFPYGAGWIDPGYLSYPDPAFYDSSAYPAPQPEPAAYPAAQHAPPPEQAEAAPNPSYRPAYQRPQPEAPVLPLESITLVFRDGRPAEQIHNYLLTRTTLYVQDDHLRPIPVDQLDLAAMVKVNADAGIDFKLPTPTR